MHTKHSAKTALVSTSSFVFPSSGARGLRSLFHCGILLLACWQEFLHLASSWRKHLCFFQITASSIDIDARAVTFVLPLLDKVAAAPSFSGAMSSWYVGTIASCGPERADDRPKPPKPHSAPTVQQGCADSAWRPRVATGCQAARLARPRTSCR